MQLTEEQLILLNDYIEQTLDDVDRAAVEALLTQQPELRDVVEAMQRDKAGLAELAAHESWHATPDVDLTAAALTQVEAEDAQPVVGHIGPSKSRKFLNLLGGLSVAAAMLIVAGVVFQFLDTVHGPTSQQVGTLGKSQAHADSASGSATRSAAMGDVIETTSEATVTEVERAEMQAETLAVSPQPSAAPARGAAGLAEKAAVVLDAEARDSVEDGQLDMLKRHMANESSARVAAKPAEGQAGGAGDTTMVTSGRVKETEDEIAVPGSVAMPQPVNIRDRRSRQVVRVVTRDPVLSNRRLETWADANDVAVVEQTAVKQAGQIAGARSSLRVNVKQMPALMSQLAREETESEGYENFERPPSLAPAASIAAAASSMPQPVAKREATAMNKDGMEDDREQASNRSKVTLADREAESDIAKGKLAKARRDKSGVATDAASAPRDQWKTVMADAALFGDDPGLDPEASQQDAAPRDFNWGGVLQNQLPLANNRRLAMGPSYGESAAMEVDIIFLVPNEAIGGYMDQLDASYSEGEVKSGEAASPAAEPSP